MIMIIHSIDNIDIHIDINNNNIDINNNYNIDN